MHWLIALLTLTVIGALAVFAGLNRDAVRQRTALFHRRTTRDHPHDDGGKLGKPGG